MNDLPPVVPGAHWPSVVEAGGPEKSAKQQNISSFVIVSTTQDQVVDVVEAHTFVRDRNDDIKDENTKVHKGAERTVVHV